MGRGDGMCADSYGNPTKLPLPKWKWNIIKGRLV